MSRLSASIPGLEDDPRWRPTTSCPSPTSNEASLMKDGMPSSSSFSKGMLDDEWYLPPDNSLMDEMKELSYASSIAAASQQSETLSSSTHFNLDSPHLQSFLARTRTTRPSFNGIDGRSNLSTFLDGSGGLPFDGTGGNNPLMSNFRSVSGLGGLGGGAVLMETPNEAASTGSLSNLLGPGLGNRGCVSNELLLRNLSPRNGVASAPSNDTDGNGFNSHNQHQHQQHHSLAGNLSSILTNGISNSFSNSSGMSPLANNSPYSSSSSTPRGMAHSSTTPFGNGCVSVTPRGDGGFNGAMNMGSRNDLAGGKDNSMIFQSNAVLPQLDGSAAATSSTPASGGASNPSTIGGGASGSQHHQHHQTLFQKRAALRHSVSREGTASPTIKSPTPPPTQVLTSGSNNSCVDMPEEDSPNVTVDNTTTPTIVPPTQATQTKKSGWSGSSKKVTNNGNMNSSSKAIVPSFVEDGGVSCGVGNRRPPQPPPAPPQPSGSDEAGEGNLELDGDQQLDGDDGKDDDDMDESGEGSGVLYETDDMTAMEGSAGAAAGGSTGRGQGGVGNGGANVSGEKGKGKKGLPAKNLMAERRRRKKLNDRLYLLRSVVPKITKMDRASILGDAIEYLKELLQRINDLHTELESTPAERPLPLPPPSPAQLPPPTPSLARVKEEPPMSLPSPDPQPARVEVRTREGKALNIHMFCQRKPGLLLSTMRALDGLGLDVQQAVISCFNGFALDVFRAEQSKEAEVGPEEIRSVLLHAAGSSLNAGQ